MNSLPLLLLFLIAYNIISTSACGPGKFRGSSGCELCPAGTYNDKRSVRSCTPCRAGTYNPYKGAQGSDVCRSCPRNTSSTILGASSFLDCTPCAPGLVSDGFSFPCRVCPPGTKTPGSADVCVRCDEGTYQVGNSCVKCPPGTVSPRGAASISECQPCPMGTELRFGRRCDPCGRGRFYDPANRRCLRCPPGTFSNAENAVVCLPCPPGTYSFSGASSCRACPFGRETNSFGNVICRYRGGPCPPNYVETSTGDCISCPAGYRLQGSNCVNCPQGSVSPKGISTTCQKCSAMEDVDYESSECICAEGHFLSETGCTPCPAGTFRNFRLRRIQVTQCEKCPGGTFSSSPGQAECTECPEGTVAERPGSTSCNTCPTGLVVGSLRQFRVPLRCVIPATNCPPNYTRKKSRFGRVTCRALFCPRNFFFSKESAMCETCEAGERPSSGGCKACKSNQTSRGGTSRCAKCSNGFVRSDSDGTKCTCSGKLAAGRRLINGKCKKCPLGSVSNGESGGCTPCPAGTKSNVFRTECFRCFANQTSTEGSYICRHCPSGTASYGLGDAACFPLSS